MKHCLVFSREIFYVTILLHLNTLWLKEDSEITARQLRKHVATKVCSIAYLTTEIEISIANFKSPGPIKNYRIFNVRTIVKPFK